MLNKVNQKIFNAKAKTNYAITKTTAKITAGIVAIAASCGVGYCTDTINDGAKNIVTTVLNFGRLTGIIFAIIGLALSIKDLLMMFSGETQQSNQVIKHLVMFVAGLALALLENILGIFGINKDNIVIIPSA